MHYRMTTPCDECPFLKPEVSGMKFTKKQLEGHASGEFPCHKQSDLRETEDKGTIFVEKKGGKTAHCAGALIYLEKRNRPHQMMRIAERLGMYDHTKLNMEAPVL